MKSKPQGDKDLAGALRELMPNASDRPQREWAGRDALLPLVTCDVRL